MTTTGYGGGSRGGTGLLCGLALLALAGCGGGSSSSSSSPSSPKISGQPVTQAQIGQAYSFMPVVANSSGKAVSFSIRNKPTWASFSISTGQLTGTPTSSDVGIYERIVISASNGASRSALSPFTLTVGQSNAGSVTLSWTAPTTNTDGSPLTDLGGYTIEYGTNASSLTQSVTVGTASDTTYTFPDLTAGTWYFSVAAYTTDGSAGPPSSAVSMTVD